MSPADPTNITQFDTTTSVNMSPAQANVGTTRSSNNIQTKPRPEMPVIEDRDLHFVYKDNKLLYNGYARLPTEKIKELIDENSDKNLPRELIEAQMKLYGEHAPWSPFRQVLYNQMRNYADIGGASKHQYPQQGLSGLSWRIVTLFCGSVARLQPTSKRWRRSSVPTAKYNRAVEQYERELAAWEVEQRAARDNEVAAEDAQLDVPMKED